MWKKSLYPQEKNILYSTVTTVPFSWYLFLCMTEQNLVKCANNLMSWTFGQFGKSPVGSVHMTARKGKLMPTRLGKKLTNNCSFEPAHTWDSCKVNPVNDLPNKLEKKNKVISSWQTMTLLWSLVSFNCYKWALLSWFKKSLSKHPTFPVGSYWVRQPPWVFFLPWKLKLSHLSYSQMQCGSYRLGERWSNSKPGPSSVWTEHNAMSLTQKPMLHDMSGMWNGCGMQ